MFQYIITIILLLSSIVFFIMVVKGKILHPLNFIFLFWLLPVYLSSLHLSYFQDVEWCDNMKITLLLSFLFLYIIPLTGYLLFEKNTFRKKSYIDYYKLNTNKINILACIISMLYIILYFGENYFLTNSFFPFLSNFDIHVSSTPILSIITRNPILVTSILAFSYSIDDTKLKKLKIFIIFLIIMIPFFTRGARYDSILSFTTVIVIIYFTKYKNRKERNKFALKASIFILILLILILCIGQVRMTDFGKYNISYAKNIKYKSYPGPGEIFAIYYANFPMSIENLNLFIKNFDNSNIQYTYVIHSLDFLFRGIFNVDNLFGNSWDFEKKYTNLREWYIGGATVPTAFAKFYMDLGPFATITPFMFLCLAIYFYYKGLQNKKYYLLYTVTIIPFIYISFTNIITTRETFINIIFWYLLFSTIKRANYKK